MTAQEQAAALEKAIFDRARSLAEEHRQQAERIAEEIRRDTQERRSRFEAMAESRAASRAEREYRRLIQAAEIRLQAELDRMRWGLVESVLHTVDERLQQLRDDADAYPGLLRRLLSQASKEIKEERLTVRVREADYERLEEQWEALTVVAAPDKVLTLSKEPFPCSGKPGIFQRDPQMLLCERLCLFRQRLFQSRLHVRRNHCRRPAHGFIHGRLNNGVFNHFWFLIRICARVLAWGASPDSVVAAVRIAS